MPSFPCWALSTSKQQEMNYPLGQDPGGKSHAVPSRLATRRHQVRAQQQTKLTQPAVMVRSCWYENHSSTLIYNSVVVKLNVKQLQSSFYCTSYYCSGHHGVIACRSPTDTIIISAAISYRAATIHHVRHNSKLPIVSKVSLRSSTIRWRSIYLLLYLHLLQPSSLTLTAQHKQHQRALWYYRAQ